MHGHMNVKKMQGRMLPRLSAHQL